MQDRQMKFMTTVHWHKCTQLYNNYTWWWSFECFHLPIGHHCLLHPDWCWWHGYQVMHYLEWATS